MSTRPLLIMAGGTGGHVYPALAIARFMRERGIPLCWLGTAAGLEARVVPADQIPLYTISARGLRGKGWLRRLASPFMLLRALWESLAVLIRIRPFAVIGMGGYCSGPGGIAAWLLRVPLYIHEQNAVAGLTNRLLAPLARVVMTGFPGILTGGHTRVTGNPVRADIVDAAPTPETRYRDGAHERFRVLVLGGSLGARAINELLPHVIAGLPDGMTIELRHQTGRELYEAACAAYRARGYEPGTRHLDVVPYIEDMAAAYAWADLVICRAGALTVSEISVMGLASILIPFPYAVDDHQTANARYLAEAGAAVLIQQADLDATTLADLLSGLASDRERLLAMGTAARRQAWPEATATIGDICLEVAHA